ncbi:ABC transporter ATP-binding protein [Aeromonas bivalvium]|uniref:ABC transporter ATP-binding protein n=1 Tax=Aeromonas bivalvium TaxID=440079 RepID=UPI0038D1ADE8
MMSAYLQLEHISKHFDGFTAVNPLSLAIEAGEFVCFLGPSGCGKTTMLRMIAGLETPSSGSICQGGLDVTLLPPEARDFGIVFQSYALFPNLTVAENIAIGLRQQKLPSQIIAARVDEWLALVHLEAAKTKYPAQLSGGQQQRVALARALILSPGLLLLDEPLSALDAKVRVHLRDEIKRLQRRLGITTIMVTHDQEEALTMADRILVMNAGRIEQFGTPEEIYRAPASRFVANFVGQMNFLPGQLACPGEGIGGELGIRPEALRLSSLGGQLPVEISDCAFQGNHVRVACHHAALAEPLQVHVPLREVAALELAPGRHLHLEIPRDQLHHFRPEPTCHA